MRRVKLVLVGTVVLAAVVSAAWALGVFRRDHVAADHRPPARPIGRMVDLPGGTFRIGNDLSNHPDERPAHEVSVGPFSIDEHEVTNGQFARFVAETGCRTTAEQRGWSYVYDRKRPEWVKLDGADWRHPGGADTSLVGREDYPVVHVSWYDAVAYAQWAGKQLPTEAQWEYAARSGFRDADFPWGPDELVVLPVLPVLPGEKEEKGGGGRYQANYRQHGKGPADSPEQYDGYERLAPVRSFPPSPFGLYDISGNVWEWCADWYGEDYYRSAPRKDPFGPDEGKMRVQRGGSWLSPEEFRFGHHVSTRGKRPPEATYQHVGFRCVRAATPERLLGNSQGITDP